MTDARMALVFSLLALSPLPLWAQEPTPAQAPGQIAAPADAAPPPTPAPATAAESLDAQPAGLSVPGAQDIDNPWLRALVGGRFDLNVRFRYEFADIDGFESSNALTMRTRLGYTTREHEGLQAAIRLDNNLALDDSWYNAAGLNGQPNKSVIADPEDTRLNELWAGYDAGEHFEGVPLAVKGGRQRVVLDDARFVGDVGWRQLNQTFDAVGLTLTPAEGFTAYYAYLEQVNRIFGPDADRDFDSDSHLVNVSYETSLGKLTGFAYLLDLSNAGGQAVSSQSYGVRLSGDRPIDEQLTFAYAGSVAWQSDFGENPTDYEALYLAAEGKLASKGGLFGALGFELLGSDDGAIGFSTPLATLHKFNGFADAFLNTPAVGLRDYYATLGATLPEPFDGKVFGTYHHFTGDDNDAELGREMDLVATHRFNPHVTGLIKWAYFDGKRGRSDIHRLWLQMELKF